MTVGFILLTSSGKKDLIAFCCRDWTNKIVSFLTEFPNTSSQRHQLLCLLSTEDFSETQQEHLADLNSRTPKSEVTTRERGTDHPDSHEAGVNTPQCQT